MMVIVLGLLLQGCKGNGATPATSEKPAAPAMAEAPAVKSAAMWVPRGGRALRCAHDEWQDPSNGKDQSIEVNVDLGRLTVLEPEPRCAKESYGNKLTFTVGALPNGHKIEIDILTSEDPQHKLYKGPFKRKGPKAKYPVAGRCVMEANDSCVFDSHNPDVKSDAVFSYNITLWDADDNFVHEKDPGIMVIDNP